MIDAVLVELLILVGSLVVLAFSSHYAIKAIEKLIALTGLSEMSAGFILLATLTSVPEIIVALFSVLEGEPGISVGDILGSNVFNIGAVLGILGIFGYLKTCCTNLLLDLTDILFLTSLIPLLLVIFNISSPIVGVLLLGTFVANTYFMAKKRTPAVEVNGNSNVVKTGSKTKVLSMLAIALLGVIVAARLVVSSGVNIAVLLGAPPILLGAKVIAIGTSLPEFTTDLAAVRRGRVHLAIGGIIGSNLTNLTLVLGLVLLTSPSVEITILTELLPFLLITTVVFWRFLTRGGISKIGGLLLLITYVLFQVFVV
ncbi:MAG: sodium:calcium antiporter [Candidatus Bathyarchaeota archaeon]|nr:sodium:calcium antiporter [Candidatus Bathyarchaeota archaeon]